jgi:hypothetical protein
VLDVVDQLDLHPFLKATLARFRVRHEQALAGLLGQSLKLGAAAGMVRLGLPGRGPRARRRPR